MANGRALVQATVAFFVSLSALSAFADESPVPFKDAYQDGYVYVAWATYTDADLSKTIARVKQTGATHLTLPYFGCQTSITSADVGACSVGTQEQVIREAKIAISQGLAVTLLPIVTTPKWDWRGTFNPTDVDAWFASYKTWLKGVIEIANELELKEFIVGSEFSILYDQEDRWSALLDDLRSDFEGPLIVTVNWGKLDYSFWSHADAVGVSYYFPLSSKDSPNSNDLDAGTASVKNQLMDVSQKYNRPIYITEVGYGSTSHAAKTPWIADASDGVNQQLQADCFDSMRRAWSSETSLARFTIWATGDLTSADYPYSFETIGKLAEKPVTQFFSERAQLSHSDLLAQ
jgi:hypothetical protein